MCKDELERREMGGDDEVFLTGPAIDVTPPLCVDT